MGTPEGANVTAVIYENNPASQLPVNSQLLARSEETVNVTFTSGKWYNFTMNFEPYGNTTYWFGYFSDGFTRNYFDAEANHVSGISLENTLPRTLSGSFTSTHSVMSLYALYERGNPNPAPTPTISALPVRDSLLLPDVITAICVSSAAAAAAFGLEILRRKKQRHIELVY